MVVYTCENCCRRLQHDHGSYYSCSYCGETAFRNKVKRSEQPSRWYFDEQVMSRNERMFKMIYGY